MGTVLRGSIPPAPTSPKGSNTLVEPEQVLKRLTLCQGDGDGGAVPDCKSGPVG